MHCRRCDCDRPTYPDVVANQRVERCTTCHYRVADGPLLDRNVRCLLLTSRELSSRGGAPFDDVVAMIFGRSGQCAD